MDGITFRCLYENCTGGVIFSGTVTDHTQGSTVDFKYAAGVDVPRTEYRNAQEKGRPLAGDRELDYFILSTYTPPMIRVLLREIRERPVRTVILPYVAPMTRLQILSEYEESKIGGREEVAELLIAPDEVAEFLTAPDEVLRRYGVMKRYFLYGNGEDLPKDYISVDQILTSMEEGEYLEDQGEELCAYVNSMEGCRISLKKAGYIKKADWLFYLGMYGPDIRDREQSHFSRPTLIMFTGPVKTDCSKYAAKVYETALNMEESCMNRELDQAMPGCVKCIYQSEYITFRSVNKDPVPHEVFGHYLLGSYNLNENLGEMLNRYSGVREMIRINAIPNCGSKGSWNHCFPSLFPGDYSKFWYINIMPYTDSQVLLDIAKTSPRNRFLLGTDQISYCLNGTIRPRNTAI